MWPFVEVEELIGKYLWEIDLVQKIDLFQKIDLVQKIDFVQQSATPCPHAPITLGPLHPLPVD